ncbi:MAG: hypothetical protein KAS23_14905, partial [Anaerohalosphaera sp.]|nr:hypothetical protein [Anaerohalosphaera sp.]
LNALRPGVIDAHDLPKFEFSQNYFIFYDKLEKANTFLQRIIDRRDRDLMDRELTMILKDPCSDGGFWESTKDLLTKYGAVPSDVMPPTNSSAGTSGMNKILKLKLRSDAAKLRKMHEDGKKVNQLIQAKGQMLADIYKILAINLGTPPTEFVWRYETSKAQETDDEDADEDGDEDADDDDDADADDDEEDKADEKESTENKKLTEPKRYTPKSFFKEFANIDLDEYVNIFNDTTHPFGKRYQITLTRNLYDGHDIDYINTTIDHLKQIAMESIIDGTPLLFAADVSVGHDSKLGIFAQDIYDYESIYGIDLSFSKAQRALYRNSVRNHGMVFVGVDVQNGKPVKWRVENSWGTDKGAAGYWTMYTDWFEMNVYNIIVKKKYVPAELLEIRKQEPTVLPAWDPMM